MRCATTPAGILNHSLKHLNVRSRPRSVNPSMPVNVLVQSRALCGRAHGLGLHVLHGQGADNIEPAAKGLPVWSAASPPAPHPNHTGRKHSFARTQSSMLISLTSTPDRKHTRC